MRRNRGRLRQGLRAGVPLRAGQDHRLKQSTLVLGLWVVTDTNGAGVPDSFLFCLSLEICSTKEDFFFSPLVILCDLLIQTGKDELDVNGQEGCCHSIKDSASKWQSSHCFINREQLVDSLLILIKF